MSIINIFLQVGVLWFLRDYDGGSGLEFGVLFEEEEGLHPLDALVLVDDVEFVLFGVVAKSSGVLDIVLSAATWDVGHSGGFLDSTLNGDAVVLFKHKNLVFSFKQRDQFSFGGINCNF